LAKSIRIENPAPGGESYIRPRAARRYIKAGRVEFVGAACDVIRFLDVPMTAVVQAHAEERLHLRTTGYGYDRLNGMYVQNARHIPIIHPERMR
jgi:hypothetical protein